MFNPGDRVVRIYNFGSNVFNAFLKDEIKKVTDVFTITESNGEYCNIDNWKPKDTTQFGDVDGLYFSLDNFQRIKPPLFNEEGIDDATR